MSDWSIDGEKSRNLKQLCSESSNSRHIRAPNLREALKDYDCCMSRKKPSGLRGRRKSKVSMRSIIYVSTFFLICKTLWQLNLQGRGLLGADGENYLEALNGLVAEGIYSNEGKLAYWPAGYPILMWPFAELSLSNLPFMIGIAQSLIFSISIGFLAYEVSESPFRKFTIPMLILLNLNPTLSLNSVVIGYEVLTASLMITSVCFFLRFIRMQQSNILNANVVMASISLSLACFVQPRISLLALGVIIPFAAYVFRGKMIVIFLIFTITIVGIGPSALALRNLNANGYAAVSVNLGATMSIGAGPFSNGGYSNKSKGVPCNEIKGDAAEQDRHTIKCVLTWYLKNPTSSLKLFANKFIFHWSPWFGPLANGTMARNPWLNYHPFKNLTVTEEGQKILYGPIGKLTSWIWLTASLASLILGFLALRRRGGSSTFLAWALFLPTILNTLSSIGTIGDHRFRIPTLVLSCILQIIGLYSLINRRLFKRGIEGSTNLFKANAFSLPNEQRKNV